VNLLFFTLLPFLFLFINTVTISPSAASACCASSTAAPSLMTEDSKAQTTLSSSYSDTIGHSSDDGSSVFYNEERSDTVLRFRLSQTIALDDRWQISASTDLLRTEKKLSGARESTWAWGDTSLGASYEILPEYTYYPIRPRVFLSSATFLPTGRAADARSDRLGTNVSSNGAWGFAVSGHALKTWSRWDTSLTSQHVRYLSQTRTVGRNQVRFNPGALTTVDLAGGFHSAVFGLPSRFGLSVGPEWQASAAPRLVWNVGGSVSVTPHQDWAASLNYNDQTLLGPTYNATLSRQATLRLTKRLGG